MTTEGPQEPVGDSSKKMETDFESENSKVFPMDRGYSWVVLISGFIVYMIVFGMVCSYGVYVVTFLKEFNCSNKEANSVGALIYAAINFSGPLASILYIKFGTRISIVSGSLVCAFGYFLSYFTDTVYQLMFTQTIAGIGFGMQIVPCITSQTEYFDKYRSFAISFVTIGASVGLFIFPPLFLFLIDTFGMRGSMLINAGIALQSAVCGMLMVSRKERAKTVKLSEMFNFSVFKDRKFYAIAYTAFAWSGCCFTYYSMINGLGVSHKLSQEEAALSVSVCGIVDTLCRVLGALLTHFFFNYSLPIYTLSTQIFGVGILVAAFSYSLPAFLVATSVFGVGFGLLISHFSVVCLWVFGLEHLSSVHGYSFMSGGIGTIIISLLGGAIADEVGRLEPSFYFLFAVSCTGVVSCFSLIYYTYVDRKQKENRAHFLEAEEEPLKDK